MKRPQNKARRPRYRVRHPRRRGIVLLVIISILVLFMLMLVTFAVVSSHYRDAARSFGTRSRWSDSEGESRQAADTILQMLLSEPASANSSLWGHSFLSDHYGDSINGVIPTGSNVSNEGTFCLFAGERDSNQSFKNPAFSKIDGFYAGCVLTMKDGPCAGLSTRITHYLSHVPNSAPYNTLATVTTGDLDSANQNPGTTTGTPRYIVLRVEAFENGQVPVAGNHFVVNGKPFNGTGLGRPTTGMDANEYRNDDAQGGLESALLPHLARWTDRLAASNAMSGGLDEPWDTFDYQNMYLALVSTDPSSPFVMPSFHRQDLIAYWKNRASIASLDTTTDANELALLRRISFRPIGGSGRDHENFTGSNPAFSYDNPATWDVDNDGDGTPDSIWIDPGLPVATAPDGRKYKRLVAIMIRDLDGRLSVNSQGHPEFAKDYARPDTAIPTDLGQDTYLGGNPMVPKVSRGLGYGPADINFANLFEINGENNAATAASLYQLLLQGTNTAMGVEAIPGRYGFDTFTGQLGNRRPGYFGPNHDTSLPNNDAGLLSNDPLSVIKTQGFGPRYDGQAISQGPVYSNFSTPTDVWGRGALALDYNGQPVTLGMGGVVDWLGDGMNETLEVNDNPYEINLFDEAANVDTPYTVAELEAVLRRNDPDFNQLPPRLYKFLNDSSTNPLTIKRRSELVGLRGSHVSAPKGAVPPFMRDDPAYTSPVPASVLDIAYARIKKEAGAITETETQRIMRQLMPFEFFRGEMFNINREFGNGVDDNGNGAVDEPRELAEGQEQAWSHGAFATAVPQGAVRALNDAADNWYNTYPIPAAVTTKLAADPQTYSRHLFARNLFCLLLLLDPDFNAYATSTDQRFSDGNGDGPSERREWYLRRLAQYCVNVVDFRDSDAIMTPFEFDLNPWDGWDVDGDPGTNEASGMNPITTRRLVWGMEYPDLQVTEHLATHDRRVKDTAHDNGTTTPQAKRQPAPNEDFEDPNLDQYGIPEGSLFLELYCARNFQGNNIKMPRELYSSNGQLDLGRLAPARTIGMNNGIRHPVWRAVVTTNPLNPTMPMQTTSLRNYPALRPDTAHMDPSELDLTPERIIWFSPLAPTNTPEENLVFYERTGSIQGMPSANSQAETNVLLAPGQYVVAGPRAATHMGSLVDTSTSPPSAASPHSFLINAGAFSTAGGILNNGYNPYPQGGQTIQSPRGIICAADPPAAWTTLTTWQVGMNISEPLPNGGDPYYPEPRVANKYYADLSMVYDPASNYTYDEPFDGSAAYPGPITDDTTNGPRTGTRTDFRSLFVQRLANPTMPWNPDPSDAPNAAYYNSALPVNPYITIDWSSLDLTVFSGNEDTDQELTDSNGVMEWIDKQNGAYLGDEDPYGAAPDERMAGRERGNPVLAGTPLDNDLWANRFNDPLTATTTPTGDPPATLYWDVKPVHTLGFLNSTMGTPIDPNPAPNTAYRGAPPIPFAWLTWNNRPFANPAELMMVPASGPARLGLEFRHQTVDPYDATTGAAGFFGHLFNFFLPEDNSATPQDGPDMNRVLDFVETPSPYVGAERWYSPGAVGTTSAGITYRPPFNRLSRFRDPGRVNINTMTDPIVWNAVVATFPELQSTTTGSTFFNDLIKSRRGYDETSTNMFQMQNDRPSLISNPFRPADAADLMPLAALRQDRPVDATLLRRKLPGAMSTADEPLFNFNPYPTNGTPGDVDDAQAYHATNRNAFFRYQPYTKLANMLTTNSNTFAVWVTVGNFEVETNPNGVDVAHPDGYRLKEELRTYGDVVDRSKAFYLIDRSIPVGFEPGQALNTEKCVLLRRYLE